MAFSHVHTAAGYRRGAGAAKDQPGGRGNPGNYTGLVAADAVDVSAVSFGIDVEDGSPFTLTGSRVDALKAVNGRVELEGPNDLSLPPLRVLGAIGVPPILLALVLDQVRTFGPRSAATEWRQLPPSCNRCRSRCVNGSRSSLVPRQFPC